MFVVKNFVQKLVALGVGVDGDGRLGEAAVDGGHGPEVRTRGLRSEAKKDLQDLYIYIRYIFIYIYIYIYIYIDR